MNQNNAIAPAAGLLAGFAAAVLYLSVSGTLLAGPLTFILPLPIYLAAFAYGTRAAIAAVVASTVIVLAFGSPANAAIMALLLVIPAAIIGHQTNLAQTLDERENAPLIWFPVPSLLFNLTAYLVIGAAIVGAFINVDMDQLTDLYLTEFQRVLSEQSGQTPTEAEVAQLKEVIVRVLPFSMLLIWMAIHVANAAIAERITRASGRMARPQTDLAAETSLPRMAIAILLAGYVLMFGANGGLGAAGGAIAGAFTCAFALVGLASVHLRARTKQGGGLLVFMSYLLIILFQLPIFFFAALGMFRAWQRANPTNTPTTT